MATMASMNSGQRADKNSAGAVKLRHINDDKDRADEVKKRLQKKMGAKKTQAESRAQAKKAVEWETPEHMDKVLKMMVGDYGKEYEGKPESIQRGEDYITCAKELNKLVVKYNQAVDDINKKKYSVEMAKMEHVKKDMEEIEKKSRKRDT